MYAHELLGICQSIAKGWLFQRLSAPVKDNEARETRKLSV